MGLFNPASHFPSPLPQAVQITTSFIKPERSPDLDSSTLTEN